MDRYGPFFKYINMNTLHKLAAKALKTRNNVWFNGFVIPHYDEYDKVQVTRPFTRAFYNEKTYIAANDTISGYFRKLYHDSKFNGRDVKIHYSSLSLTCFYVTDNSIDPALNNTIVYLVENNNSFGFDISSHVRESSKYNKKVEDWSEDKLYNYINSDKFSIADGLRIMNEDARSTTSMYAKFLRDKKFNLYDLRESYKLAITYCHAREFLKRDVNSFLEGTTKNLGFKDFETMKSEIEARKKDMTISSIEQIGEALENDICYSTKEFQMNTIDDICDLGL